MILLLTPWIAAFAGAASAQNPGLFAPVFTDHMVLQQEAPIKLWGLAAPLATVTVEVAGSSATATADAGGGWRIEFPPLKPNGPIRIEAHTNGGEAQTLNDVLIGDVFLCSGQSNMELPLSRAPDPEAEIARATDPSIRLLHVPHGSAPLPRESFDEPMAWEVATPEAVRDFSALCYLFAQELRKSRATPIGLINSSRGGTHIESWIKPDVFAQEGLMEAELSLLRLYAADRDAADKLFAEQWEGWWRGLAEGDAPWRGGDGDWSPAPSVMADWKTWGRESLARHNGMVWFRKEFVLTADQARQASTISLGQIDEIDMTWMNGSFVGGQFGWAKERRYPLGGNVLREGRNVIVMNIYSSWDHGGMLGPNSLVGLDLAEGARVDLSEGWEYRKVSASIDAPPNMPWESVGGVAVLNNAMIAPLGPLPLAGAIWYQGESNVGAAASYQEHLRLLITGWREQFSGDLPVIVIQLPNFGSYVEPPAKSAWAEMRDAQRRAVADDPHAALVVTVDVGVADDLHPPNKRPVAERAALIARRLIYDEKAAAPVSPVRAWRRGDKVIVTLNGAAAARDVKDVRPIELCGEAAGDCRLTKARIDGEDILAEVPKNWTPARVRYCWGDSPRCNVYDASGLPLSPFELPIE